MWEELTPLGSTDHVIGHFRTELFILILGIRLIHEAVPCLSKTYATKTMLIIEHEITVSSIATISPMMHTKDASIYLIA